MTSVWTCRSTCTTRSRTGRDTRWCLTAWWVSRQPVPDSLVFSLSPRTRSMCLTTRCVCLQPQHTNVCFWFIPPSLRGMPDGDERREKLHRVSRHLCLVAVSYLLLVYSGLNTLDNIVPDPVGSDQRRPFEIKPSKVKNYGRSKCFQ